MWGLLPGDVDALARRAEEEIEAARVRQGKLIVVALPDTGERYLSTALFREG